MITSSRPSPLAQLSAALLALGTASCIERPYGDSSASPPRAQVDRAALEGSVLLRGVPANMNPVGAVFGNAAELLGYTVEPAGLVAGQRARITLFWRCRAELEPWRVFVHLDDALGTGERIHAEHDVAQGRYPTEAWHVGDIIADPFVIQAGHTPLNLFLGFYSQGEARLQLDSPGRGRDDGSNRLWAGTIPLAQ